MFSPNAQDFSKLIEISFIAGIKQENIKIYINTEDNQYVKAECLLAFPDQKELVSPGILDFVFPTGLKFSYSEETPKFYSIAITNEKGIRSYIYILKVFEKIEVDDFLIQNCINKIQINETEDSIKSPKISHRKSNKIIYAPLAICLWSHVCSTDSFKEILHESYRIITFKTKELSDRKVLDNYRYCELMSYFIYLNSIIRPPTFTKLNINFRFSQVDFYFSSNYELPLGDSNIKVLFDCLEISIIIKLWSAILTEKQIIIMANQGYLLYSICEALMRLIFPFKWLHTYIPVLPENQIDYLEAPTPYLMGVLYSSAEYTNLIETFPGHVICNVDTSQIHSDSSVSMPRYEETKLRKKLQFVKNPEIFDIEEIILKPYNNTLIEDVNHNRTFSENVQYIFFRVIRNALTGFDKKYMNEKVFDPALFLEEFSMHEQHKLFWQKIISTIAFEYFIVSSKYLEDSNTKIFKNIVKLDEDIVKTAYYNYSINLPPKSVSNLFKEITGDNKNKIELFEQYYNDYKFILKLNSSHYLKQPTRRQSSAKQNQFRKSSDDLTNTYFNFKDTNFMEETFSSTLKASLRFDASDYCMKILNKNKEKDYLSFYSNSNKEGFINFIENLNNQLVVIKKDLTDFGIRNELMNKILEEIEIKIKDIESPKVFNEFKLRKRGSLEFVEETIDDFDVENFSENSKGFQTTGGINNFNNTGTSPNREIRYSIKTNNNIQNEEIISEDVINLEYSETFQYYLILAFYYEDLYLSDNKKDNKKEIISNLIKLYEKAYSLNKGEFPKIRFYQIISKWFDDSKLRELKTQIKNNCKDEKEIKKNMMIKIIDVQIAVLKKIKSKKSLTIKTQNRESIISKSSTNTPQFSEKRTNNHSDVDQRKSTKFSLSVSRGNSTSFSSRDQTMKITKKSSCEERDTSFCASAGQEGKHSNFLKMMSIQVKDEIKKMKEIRKDSRRDSKKEIRKCDKSIISSTLNLVGFSLDDTQSKFQEDFVIPNCRMSIANFQNGKCNANKIMGNMKDSENELKIKNLIINNFMRINKTDKDPLYLAEDICFKLFSIVDKYNLNKYNCEILNREVLKEICMSSGFQNIKETICELQKVNITKFSNNNERICFWLNLFNFLTLFTIILKNELLSSQYEWCRFLKNSYFNIGGYEISLFEIENCILTNNSISKIIYGEEAIINSNDIRKKLIIEEKIKMINFGISIPAKSSANLRIFFPDKLNESLNKNALDYCLNNISLDRVKNILNLPEFLLWIDKNFIKNVNEYKNFMDFKIYEYIKKTPDVKIQIIKYSWKENFNNILTWEIISR